MSESQCHAYPNSLRCCHNAKWSQKTWLQTVERCHGRAMLNALYAFVLISTFGLIWESVKLIYAKVRHSIILGSILDFADIDKPPFLAIAVNLPRLCNQRWSCFAWAVSWTSQQVLAASLPCPCHPLSAKQCWTCVKHLIQDVRYICCIAICIQHECYRSTKQDADRATGVAMQLILWTLPQLC